MKKCTKHYLRNIRSAFPIFKKTERRFLAELKQDILDYDSLNPDCTLEDLTENFGTPKEVAMEYFNNMDSEQYLKFMKKSYYLKIVALFAIVMLLLFFILETYSLYLVRKADMDTIITTEEVTIIYEN